MRQAPRGFTLVELLTVIVLMAILTGMSVPKFAVLRERGNLTSARQQIEAAIVAARSTAIQKGRPAQVIVNNNQVRVTTTTAAGATITIMAAVPLDSVYHVKVAATDTSMSFDARGFASPRLGTTGIFRLVGSTRRDSVCVTVIGQLMPRGCQL